MINLPKRIDIANWTARRMRKMHRPITEGKFMECGLTPHQYMTDEITELIKAVVEEVIEVEDDKAREISPRPHWKSYMLGQKHLQETQRQKLNSLLGGKNER